MVTVQVGVKKLEHFDSNLSLPFYATEQAAGADIFASLHEKTPLTLKPGERSAVATGLCFDIPKGFELQVRPRSGLALKTPILLVNAPGTIDSDYTGELKIIVGNFSPEEFVIEHGTRLAQLVIAPVWKATYVSTSTISSTQRGEKGFGSTGFSHDGVNA